MRRSRERQFLLCSRKKLGGASRFAFFCVLLLNLTVLPSCSRSETYHKTQWMMGTVVEITWIGSPSEKAITSAFAALRAVDRKMNPNRKDSEVALINAHAGKGPLPVSEPTFQVIQESKRISKQTEGAFDITLGPLIRLWGWDTDSPHLPSREEIACALERTGMQRLTCHPPTHQVTLQKGTALDLGGIAKGFGVDQAVKTLKRRGITNFIINAGGDLYASGHPPSRLWRIGVQDPDNPHNIITTLSLTNRAIATSGDYERFFVKHKCRYHHLLDPKTGYPARGLRSVSVLSETTMEADALATALFVMGKKRAIQWLSTHPKHQGILVDEALHIYASATLKPIAIWERQSKKSVTYF